MEQFPTIETERLVLTALEAADIPAIVKYAGNRKVSEYTQNLPYPYAERDAIYWINVANQGFKDKTHFIFGIRRKVRDEFIGVIGLTIEQRFLRAELGYWIAEPFWHKGFMTEAVSAVIDLGFSKLGLNKITASYMEKNAASGRVMMKCGMIKEGELKEHIYKDSVFHTLVLYGLTKKEFDEGLK